MIRFSTEKDIDGIIHLWNEAFGDSEEEILFFLNNRFEAKNTLVFEINGEIASMLFLLEGDMHIDDIDYPSYYLYAACTLKKYRGRGLMAELLNFSKSIAYERKKYFICLKPGEKTLFDFYEKNGYKTVFTLKRCVYDSIFCSADKKENYSEFNCNREKLRNESFDGYCYFKWDKHFIDFAFLHNNFFGGYAFETCKGYALYSKNDSSLTVKETTFTSISSVFESLKRELKSDNCILTVNFPSWIDDAGEIVPSAMMTATNKHAEKIMNNIENAYLGLTLE